MYIHLLGYTKICTAGRNWGYAAARRRQCAAGVCPTVGIILLIVFMLGTTYRMHNFWAVSDPQMKQADMINFLKNMALMGALLMLLAIPQPWPFSLASR